MSESKNTPTEGVIAEIAAERRRQVEDLDWTPEHDDDEHAEGELAFAAANYAAASGAMTRLGATEWATTPPYLNWPWAEDCFKPGSPRRSLVKAAALIVAEIERIDRATPDEEFRRMWEQDRREANEKAAALSKAEAR